MRKEIADKQSVRRIPMIPGKYRNTRIRKELLKTGGSHQNGGSNTCVDLQVRMLKQLLELKRSSYG